MNLSVNVNDMSAAFDIYLMFPLTPDQEQDFDDLYKACGSIEHIEEAFDMEFSCGDGLYPSDIEDDDKLVARYDGKVCTDSMPRHRSDGKEFKPFKNYRFTIKYVERDEELVYYLNGKETFRQDSY